MKINLSIELDDESYQQLVNDIAERAAQKVAGTPRDVTVDLSSAKARQVIERTAIQAVRRSHHNREL
jgi:predicted house-cleaning NTP pyrophosphatase (Maf/HAM1 superfamily)